MGRRSYKGAFKPTNPQKYIGDVKNIVFRSLLERTFLKWCDTNESVVAYSSEETIIPYVSPLDNRVHRYFVDAYIEIKDREGNIKKFLVEIKPKSQTVPPKPKYTETGRPHKRYLKESAIWAVNSAKWEAAQKYCEKQGYQWKILDEESLGVRYGKKKKVTPKK